MTKAALSSQLFTDPECWSGRGLNPRPPARQTGTLPTELTRRRLINQHWSNIQSKNYGYNSLMSQECTGTLCSFHVKGTKWNRKQIKPLIINAILFIFFEPAIVVNRYMTCALFMTIKNWVLEKTSEFEKKTLSFEKRLGFWKNLRFEKNNLSLKKNMSFEKNLGFFNKNLSFEKKIWVLKKTWVLKKNPEFWKIWVLKKLELLQRKNYRSENKTPNLKIILFTIQISQNK